MSLLDLHAPELESQARDSAYVPPPKPKTSAWVDVGRAATAIPRGGGEAAAQVLGTAADLANAFRAMRDATPQQRKAMDRAGVPIEAFSSDFGDALRDRGREFRPDPETATLAEQLLYGFARGVAKITAGALAGGAPGVLAAGAEEAFSQADDLRRQGVDVDTRSKAGLVQGAGLAAAALPAAGQTLAGTLALYAAGGPGGFVAQQALTREILRNAGHDKIGMGYDPLDPVGLAVASLIPAGFAAYGLRRAKIAQAVRDLPDLPPAAPDTPAPAAAADAAPPSALSPVARAVQRYPQEVEDAAMVLHQTQMRDAANLGAGFKAADQHAAALARAEEQMARGEPVQVGDLLHTEMLNLSRAYDAVLSDPAGPRFDPLVLIRPEDIEAVAVSRGGWKGLGDAEVKGQGFGLVKFIWRHGEESQKPPSLRVLKDDVTAFPQIVRTYEPAVVESPQGQSFREWRVERPGPDGQPRQVVYVDKSMGDDLGRHVVSMYVQEPGKPGAGTAPSKKVPDRSPESPGKWADTRAGDAQPGLLRPAGQEGSDGASVTPVMTAAEADALLAAGSKPVTVDPAETAASYTSRVEALRVSHPDLMVQMDGMDEPVRVDDFLAAAKAEADELAADAPLMQAAAECALLNGIA